MKVKKPRPLDFISRRQILFLFPEITKKEWKRIDELLRKEMGFPLDRVAGNINRKTWNYMREWFIECIKSACMFYLRYMDKPELLIKEHPEYLEELKKKCMPQVEEILSCIKLQVKTDKEVFVVCYEDYNKWLFKLAFKDVLKEK